MICDPLTKVGGKGFDARLQDCMMTGQLDLEPTVESTLKKLRAQKQRKKKEVELIPDELEVEAEHEFDKLETCEETKAEESKPKKKSRNKSKDKNLDQLTDESDTEYTELAWQ